ncbi:succinylglutamate desuccinylase/aspartoacylase family protein [bacterium SCSIO 12741]|nr:succinylglutamate desuccinylase/aspartoacylase family protein [bacterium SCSIO 12741]
MNKVIEEPIQELTTQQDRIIGHIQGKKPGPTLLFFGGIHGNEPSGVLALQTVLKELQNSSIEFAGNSYAIAGNLWALQQNVRYDKEDLNRLWTAENIAHIERGDWPMINNDRKELVDIYRLIQSILEQEEGPFYFIDLHTTSSETIPFITINDSLLNRKFTGEFPVPVILGIEEYLDGPLLSYINELGYVAFAFEAGKHEDPVSVERHKAFVYLSMVRAGFLEEKDIDFRHYFELLAGVSVGSRNMYEIFFRYWIQDDEQFTMQPGFVNFQRISKGTLLAQSNGQPIHASYSARVFMPLYQSQGRDGFFAIRPIPALFLKASIYLRKFKFDQFLTWLPGIRWSNDKKDTLIVNKRITRFLAREIFHLLGYRSRRRDRDHWIMSAREAASRDDEYRGSRWMK